MTRKVLRTYVSDSYYLDNFGNALPKGQQYTEQEIIQHALGQAMERFGRHLQREAERHNSIPIIGLRLEICKQGWDIDVRIHLEEEGKEPDGNCNESVSAGDTTSEKLAG